MTEVVQEVYTFCMFFCPLILYYIGYHCSTSQIYLASSRFKITGIQFTNVFCSNVLNVFFSLFLDAASKFPKLSLCLLLLFSAV